jgi:hypothetical protein
MNELESYERKLQEMVQDRRGGETIDAFLLAQIKTAAKTWVIVDKLFESIIKETEMTSIETGSQGQQKTVVNPLLPQYDKMYRTLMLAFDRLGINFNATPSKLVENTKRGGDDNDPMMQFYQGK